MNYYNKYIKYKLKYINLLNQSGGSEKTAKNLFIQALKKDNGNITTILMNDIVLKLDKKICPLRGNEAHETAFHHILYSDTVVVSNEDDWETLFRAPVLCENEKIDPLLYETIFNKIYNSVGRNSKEIDYIIKSYINNTFGNPSSLENYGRYLDARTKYEILKRTNPTTKNIESINGLIELEKYIDSNKDTIESIEDKKIKDQLASDEQRLLKKQGEKNVEIVLKNENITIYHPLTESGSRYYGRNTKWCTTSKDNCMFEDFNKRGALYIIQSNKNPRIKYQLHKETKQLMNPLDKKVTTSKVLRTLNNDTELYDWFGSMNLDKSIDDRSSSALDEEIEDEEDIKYYDYISRYNPEELSDNL
jgi:hypothetical protein